MKTVICYYSCHHGNTRKVVEAMAEEGGAALVDLSTQPEAALGTLIGVGAGLLCAVTTAFAKIEIKKLTATETPAAIAFYFAVVSALGGLLTLPFGWVETSDAGLSALIASGLWIVNSLYSIGYMRGNGEHHQTRFYVCFALAIAARWIGQMSGHDE